MNNKIKYIIYSTYISLSRALQRWNADWHWHYLSSTVSLLTFTKVCLKSFYANLYVCVYEFMCVCLWLSVGCAAGCAAIFERKWAYAVTHISQFRFNDFFFFSRIYFLLHLLLHNVVFSVLQINSLHLNFFTFSSYIFSDTLTYTSIQSPAKFHFRFHAYHFIILCLR